MSAQKSQKTLLLDHLVGTSEQRWWDGNRQHLCRLHVNHQHILGRCLHRQVGRSFTLEDAIDVSRGSTELVEEIRPVGDQSPGIGIIALLIYRGQLVASCKRDDEIAIDCRDKALAVRTAKAPRRTYTGTQPETADTDKERLK
jgi:hypothetical protein